MCVSDDVDLYTYAYLHVQSYTFAYARVTGRKCTALFGTSWQCNWPAERRVCVIDVRHEFCRVPALWPVSSGCRMCVCVGSLPNKASR